MAILQDCKFDIWEGDNTFRAYKPVDAPEHSPWYIIMPGGSMIEINHHADDKVDKARAEWMAEKLQAAYEAEAKPRPMFTIVEDPTIPPDTVIMRAADGTEVRLDNLGEKTAEAVKKVLRVTGGGR